MHLTANATDSDGTISKVDFYRDASLIASDATAPYSATWSNVASGTYSLTAKATDNRGAVTTSAPVTLKVNTPPTVSLTSPANGSSVAEGSAITLAATAADADGGIAKVEFYSGANLLASVATAPYTTSWTNAAVGSHSLTAKATDSQGASTTSAAVTLTVTEAPATTLYYIDPDHLGTPRDIADESGKTVWRWVALEPFGDSAPEVDPDGDGRAFTFNLRFPGQYFDAETGMHYNYFRDYDPGVGRYVESDPIGLAGGVNTYAYAEGNPLNYADPLGLCRRGYKQAEGQAEGVCEPDNRVEPDRCATAACGAELPEPLPPSECVSRCVLAAISAAGRSCKYLIFPAAVAACKAAAKARAVYKCAKACGPCKEN